MTTFLIATGKTTCAITIFYLYFRIFLAKDKLFNRNRFYLLGSLVLSFILPWITIPIFNGSETISPITLTYLSGENHEAAQQASKTLQNWPWTEILCYIYFTGMAIFLMKTVLAYFQVFKIIRNSFYLPLGKMRMAITSKKVSPFSFFKWLVISADIQQHPSFEKMVQHEMIHSRQHHSVDLFIAEIFIILQWFNPFTWLIRKSIMENLEFIVDHEILAKGTDARDYQYSLLSFSMAGMKPAVANNFSTNLLKKRIVMMNKSKYNQRSRLHNFLIPVVLITAMTLTASFRKEANPSGINKTSLATESTEKAVLPSLHSKDQPVQRQDSVKNVDKHGEEMFLGFIMKNIVYPKEALENTITGSIKVNITFKANGVEIITGNVREKASLSTMKEIVVVGQPPKGIRIRTEEEGKNSQAGDYLNKEVERVVKTFKEVPEDLIGKTYILPVLFIIQNNTKDEDVSKITFKDEKGEETSGQAKHIVLEPGNMEPTYILDDEKIITKEDMQQIKPESIQSVEVRKQGTYKSDKLGEIKGNVVIIRMKK